MQTKSYIKTAYRIVLVAIILSGLYLSIFMPLRPGEGLPALYYFTIQSNILVVLALLYFIFKPEPGRFRAIVRGSVLLCIMATGLIFHIILVPALPEYFAEGLAFRHHITHTIAPLGFFLDWLFFDRSGQLRYADVRYWPIYPSLYWLFSVIQGSFSGLYPYFFFDAQAIGLGATILWLIGLIAIFSAIGFMLVWLDSLKLPCRSRK
ncbi:MAG: hypothetical protein FJ152_07790 [Firmicutes bacterium]|nr:hypothetical protein [Bacillota bacterium]